MIKMSKASCSQDELEQVREAFDYGYFGLAYKVTEFEDALKNYLDTDREVIAVNTGTSAIHLALDAIGISDGDEVLLPSFTFVATAQAITACGAKPVFCDINPDSLLIDIKDIERKITSRTKAIIPVHYAGYPCDMDMILKIRDKYNLRIIEDAAHAIGSSYIGRKIGSFGDITCFSFDSIKVMTCGEGGAIVSSDKEFAEIARKKRILGIDRKTLQTKDWKKRSWIYDVSTPGYRYHMSNINAAIGLAQISKLDMFILKRRELYNVYMKELSTIQEIILPPANFSEIAPFMFVVRIENGQRDALKTYLMDHDIESGISYIPCHHFTLYKENEIFPVTDRIFNEILCLPMHYELSINDIYEIVQCIKNFYSVG